MVSAAEAEKLLAEDKVIAMNIFWRSDRRGVSRRRAHSQRSGIQTFKLEASVLSLDSGEIMSLRGSIGKTNRSFALLYKNSPIRKYTVHDRHRDPVTRIVYTDPHKHIWDDDWQDRRVYIPDDIRIGDPNQELEDFLKECNILLRGSYMSQTFFQAR